MAGSQPSLSHQETWCFCWRSQWACTALGRRVRKEEPQPPWRSCWAFMGLYWFQKSCEERHKAARRKSTTGIDQCHKLRLLTHCTKESWLQGLTFAVVSAPSHSEVKIVTSAWINAYMWWFWMSKRFPYRKQHIKSLVVIQCQYCIVENVMKNRWIPSGCSGVSDTFTGFAWSHMCRGRCSSASACQDFKCKII